VGNITQTDFGYTGQRALNNGLMDYHARFYDDYLNRWTQPDTIVPDLSNPQTLNRYSYVLNDPIRYADPDGHCIFEPIEATICGVIIVGAIVVVAVGVVYLSSPQGRHAIDQTAESLTNSLDRWQQNNANQRQYDYLASVRGQTADSSGIPPSANNSGCKNNLTACVIVGVSLLFGAALAVFCTADGEHCLPNSSPGVLLVKPTPTKTSMDSPSCPLNLQCPVITSPTPARPTLTPKHSNTTSTPEIWHGPLLVIR